jgi:lipopolysaccharide/colanic/teichoic acid biosynthesis glycosyltransferase
MTIFLIISMLVLINLGRPIIFSQLRPGYHLKPFKIYKFRTMKEKVDLNSKPLSDGKRLTSFGKALRSMSFDELPSLVNVLIGEMSLVGPRPLLLEYLSLYNKKQVRRHDVKPGMTGWAQINGRNGLSWAKRFELDLWYVDNQTFFLDLKILLITLKKVLLREGITEIGQVTMSKFKGNTK